MFKRGKGLLVFGGLAVAIGLVALLPSNGPQFVAVAQGAGGGVSPLALRARDILKENCARCHPARGVFDAAKRDSLLEKFDDKAVVAPGKPEASLLIESISGDKPDMPKGGYQKQEGVPLPATDIQALKDWIKAGAPDWAAKETKARPFLAERDVLRLIVADLLAADEVDRPYLRYYSLANLYNLPPQTVSDDELKLYRTSLSKLLNSLSWNPTIAVPKPIDPAGVILRINLNDYDWTLATWKGIIASYPYGFKANGAETEFSQIQQLSGATVPYVRVDWFVFNGAQPPLYHDVLGLPEKLSELEERLGVDAERNVNTYQVMRAGMHKSNVTNKSRVLERQRGRNTRYYWKSYDYNKAHANDYKTDPISLHPNGGEFIFSLPNGLQGYFICNADGKRLPSAPTSIVALPSDPPDVINGMTCMSCHFKGIKEFKDEVRPALDDQLAANFDVKKAQKLYPLQADFDRKANDDREVFKTALAATGSPLPESDSGEPIGLIAKHYFGFVGTEQAACDVGLTVEAFKERLNRSSDLERLGLRDLLRGVPVDRVTWEKAFPLVIQALALGDYISPGNVRTHGGGNSGGGTINKPYIGADGRLVLPPGTRIGDECVNPKDGATLVFVPGGEFLRGTSAADAIRAKNAQTQAGFTWDDAYVKDEGPQRRVNLPGFWMYKTEVTVRQYLKFCQEAPHGLPVKPEWGWNDDEPIVNVSWNDAKAYAEWAGVALPSEAQWEKAARGEDGRLWPWGNNWDGNLAVNNAKKPSPVGSKPEGKSPYGCLDMAGNVWEWCLDSYDADYYALNVDGKANLKETGRRVLRGGSWVIYNPIIFRASCRRDYSPGYFSNYFGFRCSQGQP